MNIQIQYEADAYSESEMRRKGPLVSLDPDAPVSPPPDPDEPDYSTPHGIFTFDLAELQALMELAQHDEARIPMGDYWEPIRPHRRKDWPISLDDFYAQVLSILKDIKTPNEFTWEMFEPVYDAGSHGVSYLVAWLLERCQGAGYCKVCKETYPAAELETYAWYGNECEGSLYVCPQDHVLLRTHRMFLGALALFYTERREKRDRKPDPASQD